VQAGIWRPIHRAPATQCREPFVERGSADWAHLAVPRTGRLARARGCCSRRKVRCTMQPRGLDPREPSARPKSMTRSTNWWSSLACGPTVEIGRQAGLEASARRRPWARPRQECSIGNCLVGRLFQEGLAAFRQRRAPKFKGPMTTSGYDTSTTRGQAHRPSR